jgi:creatinine amidohydrolase/Fe(II)-dependent formamide hydrolase-like protein
MPFRARPLALAAVLGLALAGLWAGRPHTAPLPDKVALAGLTWVEVRAAVAAGHDTVIVPSGGIEQNGVHMALGKHDAIVAAAAERVARGLGRTLVAPVLPYVPQGAYDPPGGHLRYPGTIGVPPEVFAATLEGIARSLKGSGFRTIALLADHGGSQGPQAEVARRLTTEWAREGVVVLAVDAYYDDTGIRARLAAQGETPATIGTHAGIIDTAQLLAVWPEGVSLARLGAARLSLEPTGADGAPAQATPERGREILAMRVEAAIRQIAAARR